MEKPGSSLISRIFAGVVSFSKTALFMWIRTPLCFIVGVISGSIGLVTGVVGTVLYKSIRTRDRENSDPESQTPEHETPKTDDIEKTVMVLKTERETMKTEMETLKTEMENQMKDVKRQLDQVDEEKKKNKQKLQEMEKELKEREENYDKPEELLKEQEERLRTEWRLDKEKGIFEKQQSNLNKLMDPVETLVTRITRDPQ